MAAEGLYKDRGSKFLGFAEPIKDEDEAKARVAWYKKKYHAAKTADTTTTPAITPRKRFGEDAAEPDFLPDFLDRRPGWMLTADIFSSARILNNADLSAASNSASVISPPGLRYLTTNHAIVHYQSFA